MSNKSSRSFRSVLPLLSVGLLFAVPSDLVGGPNVGDAVIDFELKNLAGESVRSLEARKGKVLVLKFGASWCPYCNLQIKELKKVDEQYAHKGVAVIEVAVGEGAAHVRDHLKKYGVAYPVLLDGDGSVAGKYGVEGIPVVIVADASGNVVYKGNYTKFAKLRQLIDSVLRRSK